MNSEIISNYGKLRLIQRDIHTETLDENRMLVLTGKVRTHCSNAIDQIEQALEKIKADTADTVMLEIMNEIDGEVRY